MRIAVISDCHLGHAYGTVLENDSFENFEEAMDRVIDADVDLIVLGGDTFDSRAPRTKVWAKTMHILTKPLLKEQKVKFVESDKILKEISRRTLNHLPVIALHGNHERRSKEDLNVVEALENAGLLIYLNANSVVFEKDGVKVAIHGMSNVPERYAKENLKKWNPRLVNDCFNILVLHQSFEGFFYSPLDAPSISLDDLPEGFDLILDGHIHQHGTLKSRNTPLYTLGSTVVTQLDARESLIEKGFLIIEVGKKLNVNFIPLQKNRKFVYDEIKVSPGLMVRDQIEKKISELVYKKKSDKPPLVKLKISGDQNVVSETDLRSIERKYEEKAVIIFSRDFETPDVVEKTEIIRGMLENKQSVEEIGLNVLRKNLDELKFDNIIDFETLFHLLLDGESERAFNILTGEQRTLSQIMKK